MKRYMVLCETEDGKLDEIMARLEKAREEIYRCYADLREVGILKIVPSKEKAPAAEQAAGGSVNQ